MKRLLLAVSGMTLLINGMACVGPETSVMDQGQTHQEQWIDQGMTNGQQAQVSMRETRVQSNSTMTDKERARISAAQARASRHIAREESVHRGKRRR
ncbi:MAG: hypothetical protein SGJ26_16635 [Nitrospirota bacterium]|nr:hypothetical protein [Nitrospirota bacterium]